MPLPVGPSSPAALLFDLDGTLIDSASGIVASLNRALAQICPDVDIRMTPDRVGPPIREILRTLLPDLEVCTRERVALAFRTLYDTDGWRDFLPFAGAEQLLKYAHAQGTDLWIVTNKPTRPTIQIVQMLGWDRWLSGTLSPDSRNPRFLSKSEAVSVLLAGQSWPAAGVMLVGDSSDDQSAAQDNQLQFVFAAYGYGRIEPDVGLRQIQTLSDLFPW